MRFMLRDAFVILIGLATQHSLRQVFSEESPVALGGRDASLMFRGNLCWPMDPLSMTVGAHCQKTKRALG